MELVESKIQNYYMDRALKQAEQCELFLREKMSPREQEAFAKWCGTECVPLGEWLSKPRDDVRSGVWDRLVEGFVRRHVCETVRVFRKYLQTSEPMRDAEYREVTVMSEEIFTSMDIFDSRTRRNVRFANNNEDNFRAFRGRIAAAFRAHGVYPPARM
jgi:hypothetical protein